MLYVIVVELCYIRNNENEVNIEARNKQWETVCDHVKIDHVWKNIQYERKITVQFKNKS